jgi:hypothetical protein
MSMNHAYFPFGYPLPSLIGLEDSPCSTASTTSELCLSSLSRPHSLISMISGQRVMLQYENALGYKPCTHVGASA